ncbi:MAG: hypothetical protein KTR25_00525 [Myxococcales bacterium]|nr:hypothetical protein [Myxococcales bacterium]
MSTAGTSSPRLSIPFATGEDLEATPCRDRMTHGFRAVVERISEVPKRAVLVVPVSLTSKSDDFGVAAQRLNRVESGLYDLWPDDETKA